jgi:hypothetical protein
MSTPLDPLDPFSESVIANAVKTELNTLPDNQVQAGVVYDATNGPTAEVEGSKAWNDGLFIKGEATYSQRAKWGAALLFGWKPK